MTREPITHDYTKQLWGHAATGLRTEDGGQTLTGHLFGLVHEGDYVILQNGERTTRYRIDVATFYTDPGDMYRVTMSFAPRAEHQDV